MRRVDDDDLVCAEAAGLQLARIGLSTREGRLGEHCGPTVRLWAGGADDPG